MYDTHRIKAYDHTYVSYEMIANLLNDKAIIAKSLTHYKIAQLKLWKISQITYFNALKLFVLIKFAFKLRQKMPSQKQKN